MPEHDLIVIGAGPGGYVAAIRAAQLGMNVACIEKEPALGGTCLRIGCIPSKALLESSARFEEAEHHLAEHGIGLGKVKLDLPKMLDRKDRVVSDLTRGIDGLFKKNKIERYQGHGRITSVGQVEVHSGDAENVELSAKQILIATGSQTATLPGLEIDGDRIGSSTEALSYEKVPGHLVVIGAGYIGLEMGTVWRRLGARVTVLEYLERILPGTDAEIASEALKVFKKRGLEFRLGSRVTGVKMNKKSCHVQLDDADPVECDRVLVAVGRKPNTDRLGLENVGIETNGRGQIEVDEHYQTTAEGIFAIGDVIPGPMLAHKAEEEGIACVEWIATGYGHVNYNAIPSVVYTEPEIAAVGKTEEELKEASIEFRKGVFSFRGNGRARAMGHIDGKIKVLADAETDRILGVHIIGPRAGDLIAEAAVAMEFGASSEDLARCCHAHPTLAEALKEASLAVDGRVLHG